MISDAPNANRLKKTCQVAMKKRKTVEKRSKRETASKKF